jgi:hypothetical protein
MTRRTITRSVAKKSLNPDKIIKIYQEDGIELDKKNAEEILEFVYFLANLIVQQNIGNESSRSIRQS